ncbi:glycosyltransferase [bacterium]|nr:glycosyltransferase [bacterium]
MPASTDIRLAYVSQIRWPSEIPAGPFNANFVTAIARAGAEVDFIVRSSNHPRAKDYTDPLDVLRREYGHDVPHGLRIHVIPTPGWQPASDPWLYFTRAGWLLKRLRREHSVNCVMSRDTRALPHLARWRKRGLVAVHDTHNFYMDPAARDDTGTGRKWKEYPRFERSFLPQLDGVLPLLEVQAEWYRKQLTVPVRAIHPGLNETHPPDPSRFDHKTVGYVGTLSGIKGSMDVLEAFQALDRDDVKLVLIGGRGQAETDSMRQRIESLGLTGRAEVTGWLPVPEMAARLKQVSVALLPLTGTFYNRYLTAPSKLFDYLSQAVPVIASDLPAVRELAGDAALYVKPGDRTELTAAMAKLLGDREQYNRLAQTAHKQAQTLHWDRRGEGTVEFLRELLARRARTP